MLGKIFQKTLLLIIAIEFISLAGYLYAPINQTFFIAIAITAIVLSFYKLEYGIFLVLAELFIGSKGYLFFFDIGGTVISVRLILWLIVIAVWAGKLLVFAWKNKKLPIAFADSSFFRYYTVFFLFICWGLVNGIIHKNQAGNLFFDLNGWLYFALILPMYSVYMASLENGRSKKLVSDLTGIFIASAVWVALKTLILLFIFSHDISFAPVIYRWVRTTGVGEITPFMGGFSRIFIQSQIFMLISLFPLLFDIAIRFKNWSLGNLKAIWPSLVVITLLLAAILASLSRSFWLGLVGGIIIFYTAIILGKIGWKAIISTSAFLLLAGLTSFILIIAIGRFPYPTPLGSFDAASLLSGRATQISGEAGASSRWSLLPELVKKIKASPIIGSGFGSTVTYQTSDPRILQTNPSGLYTTYAFEWGWLDIWLKMGLFGLLSYVILIAIIFWNGMRNFLNISDDSAQSIWFAIGLAIIFITSISSPYTNHPLGIGYLMLAGMAIENYRKANVKFS